MALKSRVTRIPLDQEKIAEFCRKHHIRKFALFGSVLRDDFGPNSDDMILLVERAEPVCWMDPVRELPQSIAEEGINPQATQVGSPPGSRGIASHHPGGANVGLRNGAALFLSETLDLQHFREMLQGTYEEEVY
jgi:predicted nucleotidyltransferase